MPAITLEPMEPRHLGAAAALLAGRHAGNRQAEPALPERYLAAVASQALLAAQLQAPRALGVVAQAGGTVLGYLLASRELAAPGSYAKIYRPPRLLAFDAAGYAPAPAAPAHLLRILFAAVAGPAVAAGYRSCATYVPAVELPLMQMWQSLTFGVDLTLGIRDCTPPQPASLPPGVSIRRAGPDDLETVAQMVTANDRHHAGPPLFLPALPENLEVQRRVHRELLADSRNAAFLAERDGRPLGLHTYTPDEPDLVRDASAIYLQDAYVLEEARGAGVSRALLAAGLAWATAAGFARCTVAWNTANLPGARFWRAAGFRPLLHRLRRDI